MQLLAIEWYRNDNPTHRNFALSKLKISNKTQQAAKVVFSSFVDGKATYHVKINNNKLIFPTCSKPKEGPQVLFTDSTGFTFKKTEDGFFKIKEEHPGGQTVFFVAPEKVVDDIAYDAYSYKPTPMSKETAEQKLKDLCHDFPHFHGEIALYNQHGLFVFGWDDKDQNFGLYGTHSAQEKMAKMDCQFCERSRLGTASTAKSKDGSVNFREYDVGSFLNGEKAQEIILTDNRHPIIPLSPFSVREYPLLGGVKIHDETNGLAKAIVNSERTKRDNKPVYEILIKDKQILQTFFGSWPSKPIVRVGLCFINSLSISFRREGDFIKIEEIDSKETTVYYAYIAEETEAKNKDKTDGSADKVYNAYPCIPKKIGVEASIKKIQALVKASNFKPDVVVYNRFGVVARKSSQVYWALPSDKIAQQLECDYSAFRSSTQIATTKNGLFCYLHIEDRPTLNGFEAAEIPLENFDIG
jgi:hypothetical protein